MMINPEFAEQCLADATALRSKCTSDVLAIEGMSSAKIRHFLNNICSHPDASYLEIGVWKGATFCSANCGNLIPALAVDNFAQPGASREEFQATCEASLGRAADIFVTDFRQLRGRLARKFNVAFYDAGCYD